MGVSILLNWVTSGAEELWDSFEEIDSQYYMFLKMGSTKLKVGWMRLLIAFLVFLSVWYR